MVGQDLSNNVAITKINNACVIIQNELEEGVVCQVLPYWLARVCTRRRETNKYTYRGVRM